jgi:hypothetical protein
MLGHHYSLNDWWGAMLAFWKDKKTKCIHSGRILYVMSFEMFGRSGTRNIFHGVRLTYLEVTHIAHMDIRQRALAFSMDAPAVTPND